MHGEAATKRNPGGGERIKAGSPLYANEWNDYARQLHKQGNHDGEAAAYEKAFEKVPIAEYAYQAGDARVHGDDLDAALNWFRKATRVDAGMTKAWRALGYVYHARGDYAAAIDAIRTVVDLEPENVSAISDYAVVLNKAGYSAGAVSAARAAWSLDPANAELARAYMQLVEDVRLVEDKQFLEDAHRLSPKDRGLCLRLAELLHKQGDSGAALQIIEACNEDIECRGDAGEVLRGWIEKLR
jgi:tetratricopeptide (TPR) repeat protein